jgi:hypothetical protein
MLVKTESRNVGHASERSAWLPVASFVANLTFWASACHVDRSAATGLDGHATSSWQGRPGEDEYGLTAYVALDRSSTTFSALGK